MDVLAVEGSDKRLVQRGDDGMCQVIPAMFDLLQLVEPVPDVDRILQNVLQQTGALRHVSRHISEHAEEFGLPRNQADHGTGGLLDGLACRLVSCRPENA